MKKKNGGIDTEHDGHVTVNKVLITSYAACKETPFRKYIDVIGFTGAALHIIFYLRQICIIIVD
jgi:hypothetical protein